LLICWSNCLIPTLYFSFASNPLDKFEFWKNVAEMVNFRQFSLQTKAIEVPAKACVPSLHLAKETVNLLSRKPQKGSAQSLLSRHLKAETRSSHDDIDVIEGPINLSNPFFRTKNFFRRVFPKTR